MKRVLLSAVGLFLVTSVFQNCGNATRFSDGTSSTASSSEGEANSAAAAHTSDDSVPVTQHQSQPPQAGPVTCASFFLNGDPTKNGSYQSVELPPGSQVQQRIACNGRNSRSGYQASYCGGALASCENCAPNAVYVCSSSGEWVTKN